VPFVGRDRPAAPAAAAPAPAPPPPPTPARRPAPVEADEVVDRIVAVVNNDAITLGEVQEAVALYRQENRGRALDSDEVLFRQLLGRLIDARLQLQEADREKITVEDAEVEEEIAERMKRFGARTREELEAMVKAQGLSFEAVRRRVRDSLRVQKLVRRKVALRVSVTEAEIDRYLAENRDKLETGLTYHARHILITPETDTDAGWEAARIRAEMIRAQLAEGADFADLARRYSRDASARDGGDLGPLKRGELAPEIEQQILALEPGQTSAPFRSRLGWHLFRLESREALEGERLQRLRQQVRDILYRQKYEARLEAWLREIKDRAIIEVRM
jgi:peptidyl-prolyl cis-trans isomerase SurA